MLANGADRPLGIVVPELLVPVVEGLGGEELTWISDRAVWQGPVSPEGKVNTIQPETLLGFLGVRFEVPGVDVFTDGMNLRERYRS